MNPSQMVAVTPSKFAMWRAAIALAYGDNFLSNSEINIIHEWWERFDFSDAQRAQLEKDLRAGVKLDDVWDQITDKLDRAHLINFSLVLFNIDGEFSEVEKALWEEINDRHMVTIDMRGAIRDARASITNYLQEDKAKLDADYRNEKGILKAFHRLVFFNEQYGAERDIERYSQNPAMRVVKKKKAD